MSAVAEVDRCEYDFRVYPSGVMLVADYPCMNDDGSVEYAHVNLFVGFGKDTASAMRNLMDNTFVSLAGGDVDNDRA